MPVIVGHEGAGIVETVGPGVTEFAPGDHVVITPICPCGTCRYCIKGEPALCPMSITNNLMGTLPSGEKRFRKGDQEINHFYSQGSFAEYVVVHINTAVKVRKDAPLDVICLIGCGFTSGFGAVVNRAGMKAGESIVVFGCGGVGLSAVMGAKLAGAGKLIAVDLLENKLEKAKELGAEYLINASKENPQEKIMELTGGGADYSVETIGNVDTMAQAFASIHNSGKCIVVGVSPMEDLLSICPFDLLMGKQLMGAMLGNTQPKIDIPIIVDLFMEGKLPIDKLISKYYTLDQINEGFEEMEKAEIIRSVIRL